MEGSRNKSHDALVMTKEEVVKKGQVKVVSQELCQNFYENKPQRGFTGRIFVIWEYYKKKTKP